jgi:hypothetical protein
MEKIGGKILLLALPFIAIQLGASFSLEAEHYLGKCTYSYTQWNVVGANEV